MGIIELLLLLIIAGVCGALGQAVAGSKRGGFIVSIVLGFIGAVFGMWLADALDLPGVFVLDLGETSFPVVWSIVGSALFVAVLSLITRRR